MTMADPKNQPKPAPEPKAPPTESQPKAVSEERKGASNPTADAFSRCQTYDQKIDLLIIAVSEGGNSSLAKKLDATLDGWMGVTEDEKGNRKLRSEIPADEVELEDGDNPTASSATPEALAADEARAKAAEEDREAQLAASAQVVRIVE